MSEWSKEVDLRSIVFARVGSNPTFGNNSEPDGGTQLMGLLCFDTSRIMGSTAWGARHWGARHGEHGMGSTANIPISLGG